MPETRAGHVEVPGIECPFPPSTNPQAEKAQREHMRWGDLHGIFRSKRERRVFAAMDIGDLAGRMSPDSSVEDLQLLADWCAWLLLRDDRWDTTESLAEWERLADLDRLYLRLILRPDEDTQGDGLASALADLCDRLRSRARENGLPDPVDRAFVALMREFFFGSVRQAFYQRRDEYPDLDEYLELRRVTGGLEILTKVLATTDGIVLSDELLEKPKVQRLTEASHNVCCWHNDLVSLNKELQAGEVNNLILILLRESEEPSLRRAIERASRMTYEEMDDFSGLAAEIPHRVPERLVDVAEWYTSMLSSRISAVIVWHEDCAARYQEALSENSNSSC